MQSCISKRVEWDTLLIFVCLLFYICYSKKQPKGPAVCASSHKENLLTSGFKRKISERFPHSTSKWSCLNWVRVHQYSSKRRIKDLYVFAFWYTALSRQHVTRKWPGQRYNICDSIEFRLLSFIPVLKK